LRAAIVAVQSQVEIAVFLREDIRVAELKNLDQFLREHPGVMNARYLPRDEALAQFRDELKEKEYLLEALESNPLPDTFEVALYDDWKSTERISLLAEQISGMVGVDEVKYGREWVGRLNRIIVAAVLADLFLGAVVAISSLFVVANTVKLTLIARKDMIELMKMVGATAAVIRRPFVIEGILKGVLASLLAGTLLTILTWVLSQRIPEVHPLSIPLLFAFVMFGAILGGFGSIASLQGYLQRWSRE
jgi:cell division transport system permease protein